MHPRSRVLAPDARQNGKTGHIWVRTHHLPNPSDYADFPPSMSGGLDSQVLVDGGGKVLANPGGVSVTGTEVKLNA